jgi:hypothetical protein
MRLPRILHRLIAGALAGLLVPADDRRRRHGHDLYLFAASTTAAASWAPRRRRSTASIARTPTAFRMSASIIRPCSPAFDPRDARVFYVATINGVLRTSDGGRTWRIGTSWDMTEPKASPVDPTPPTTSIAALPDGIGVSPDRGQTWTRREHGLPDRGKYTQVVTVDRTRPAACSPAARAASISPRTPAIPGGAFSPPRKR